MTTTNSTLAALIDRWSAFERVTLEHPDDPPIPNATHPRPTRAIHPDSPDCRAMIRAGWTIVDWWQVWQCTTCGRPTSTWSGAPDHQTTHGHKATGRPYETGQ